MTLELGWKLLDRKQVQVQTDSANKRMQNRNAQAEVQMRWGKYTHTVYPADSTESCCYEKLLLEDSIHSVIKDSPFVYLPTKLYGDTSYDSAKPYLQTLDRRKR